MNTGVHYRFVQLPGSRDGEKTAFNAVMMALEVVDAILDIERSSQLLEVVYPFHLE